jgi:hypothetical protein
MRLKLQRRKIRTMILPHRQKRQSNQKLMRHLKQNRKQKRTKNHKLEKPKFRIKGSLKPRKMLKKILHHKRRSSRKWWMT